jgi:predicted dehydrogenase
MVLSGVAVGMLIGVAALATTESPTAGPTAPKKLKGAPGEIRLMTLDPGHFHAALVQKAMYPRVSPRVHVYAPEGQDLREHLARIDAYNKRAQNPTTWVEDVSVGEDYLERMLAERPGNVVVISGNNARKIEYIERSVEAGLNVLADKPMVIRPEDFPRLEDAFRTAETKGVLLADIMTERYEITSILERRLAQIPALFGHLVVGAPSDPAIVEHSVHHFSKLVSGRPLLRPAWFFDVRQEGEGLVDVGTHLVDLVQWLCFPDEGVDYRHDIDVLAARRWATAMTPAELEQVTGMGKYPAFLSADVGRDSTLEVFANGEVVYKIKGIHAKVTTEWRYRAPDGTGDTHGSMMRGSKASLFVRQGVAEGYQPTLYVEPAATVPRDAVEAALRDAVATLSKDYPGLSAAPAPSGWRISIPDTYKVGHEAHFAQVTKQYFEYLVEGKVPRIEVQRMLAKSYVTTRAYQLSHGD